MQYARCVCPCAYATCPPTHAVCVHVCPCVGCVCPRAHGVSMCMCYVCVHMHMPCVDACPCAHVYVCMCPCAQAVCVGGACKECSLCICMFIYVACAVCMLCAHACPCVSGDMEVGQPGPQEFWSVFFTQVCDTWRSPCCSCGHNQIFALRFQGPVGAHTAPGVMAQLEQNRPGSCPHSRRLPAVSPSGPCLILRHLGDWGAGGHNDAVSTWFIPVGQVFCPT